VAKQPPRPPLSRKSRNKTGVKSAFEGARRAECLTLGQGWRNQPLRLVGGGRKIETERNPAAAQEVLVPRGFFSAPLLNHSTLFLARIYRERRN